MNQFDETLESWNKIAQIYEDKFMNLHLYDESYDLFCDLIRKENPRILELGCGPGNITKYIYAKRPDLAIDAIDFSPNMIKLAKKNCPSATFEVMDIRLIRNLKSTYDGIICGFCIPYISKDELKKLIENLVQLITESGILYLSFVDGDYTDSGYQIGVEGSRSYFYYHSLVETIKELEKQSFTIKSLIPLLYEKSNNDKEVHTVLIAKK